MASGLFYSGGCKSVDMASFLNFSELLALLHDDLTGAMPGLKLGVASKIRVSDAQKQADGGFVSRRGRFSGASGTGYSSTNSSNKHFCPLESVLVVSHSFHTR